MSLDYRVEQPDHRPIAEEEFGPPVLRSIPVYTVVILICIGAVFFVQYLTSPEPYFLMLDRQSATVAGFDKFRFIEYHEYWRIFTGATIHSGILHFFFNSYALYSFGSLTELLSNRAHLAITFLLSAIGGNLLSLYFLPDATSVGASGGIVGLIGYLVVYAFRRRRFISAEFRRSLLINIGFILIFGLALNQIIDNYGHIGGLLTGAVYGLIQIPTNEYTDPRGAHPVARLLGFAALAIFIATSLLSLLLLRQAG